MKVVPETGEGEEQSRECSCVLYDDSDNNDKIQIYKKIAGHGWVKKTLVLNSCTILLSFSSFVLFVKSKDRLRLKLCEYIVACKF